MTQNLLSEIREFLSETGMSAYRFGYRAVKNGRLVERLEAGRRIWPETEIEARAFMRAERQRRVSNEVAQ
jgi:hypothetical protein